MISPKSRQRRAFLINLVLVFASFKYADEFDFFTISKNFKYIGIGLILIAFIIWILALIEMPRTTKIDRLVTNGIFSVVRNPRYLAAIILNFALIFYDIFLVFNAFIATFLWYYVAKKEEEDLIKVFGEEHEEYKKNVPMFLPKIRKGL